MQPRPAARESRRIRPVRCSEVTPRARTVLSLLLALAVSLPGCDGGAEPDAGPTPMDAAMDAGADAGLDAGPRVRTREVLPTPGPLMAGVAMARIPAPLGIGTMGYGAIGADASVTPFAARFPGTTHAHGTLTLKAVAISRGDAHELILVRMDTIGVFQQLREAVLDRLAERTGRDLGDALVLAGNHTHSGPGRLLMSTGALVALGDTFFPEYYDRFIEAIADVVEAALADLMPAELGSVIASSAEGHSDRRCENDALDQVQEVSDMPLVAIRRGGRLDALVASYAYHGTVLAMDDLTLSGDIGSTVEQKIEERMDHPVMVLFFNSWGADMAPGNPAADPDRVGADQPEDYDRMERVGDVIADAILPRLADITYDADATVRARTYRVRLDRDAIGYPSAFFDYPHGGAFCGIGADGNCVDDTPVPNLEAACIRISPAENLPKQTMITAGQIGALSFVTAPGEWSTALAASVLDQVRALTPGDAMFIGYANDYTGYSLGYTDWYQGGYEASGALWGPGQGDYLAARTVEAFETFSTLYNEPPWIEPARVPPFTGYTYEPYVAETAINVGTFTEDVPASVGATDIVTFTVLGSDPWLGNPVATLEHDAGDGFVPVARTNGLTTTSESYDFWVDLTTEPTYEAEPRADRAFRWTFHFPVSRRASSSIPPLTGPHRFRVRIPTSGGEVTVETGEFSVVP